MTPKQYENIGRALELIAQLNEQASAMYTAKSELADRLGRVIGNNRAHEFVKTQYGDFFSELHSARELIYIVQSLIKKERSQK